MKKDWIFLLGLCLMVLSSKIQKYSTSQTAWFAADYVHDLATLLLGSRAAASIKKTMDEKKAEPAA